MNTQELLDFLRYDILDDNPDAPTLTSSDYGWTDAFLLRQINHAQREACSRRRLITDSDTPAICQVALTSGTALYSLDSRVVMFDRALYGGDILEKTSKQRMDVLKAAWRVDTGSPTKFIQNGLNIRLYPIPTSAEDGEVLYLEDVWRRPLGDLRNDDAWTVDTTYSAGAYVTDSTQTYYFYTAAGGEGDGSEPDWDTDAIGNTTTDNSVTWIYKGLYYEAPEIDVAYHEDMLHYVAYRCYNRRDEDTYDSARGKEHYKLFERIFGPKLEAGYLENMRRQTPSSYLRPIDYQGDKAATYNWETDT